MKYTIVQLVDNTARARRIEKDNRDRLLKFDKDSDKARRLSLRRCKTCHYLRGHIGGSAFTNSTCIVCGEIKWEEV